MTVCICTMLEYILLVTLIEGIWSVEIKGKTVSYIYKQLQGKIYTHYHLLRTVFIN